MKLLKSILGSANSKKIKRAYRIVNKINKLEEEFKEFSDDQFPQKTEELKNRHAKGEPLNNLLPEAFALMREATKKTLGMRHYDVQLIGGIILHQGQIAEMRTGEGKTLVAMLPAFLNAISGKGVHVVTVNDYLAQRDADSVRPAFELLGMSVGSVVSELKGQPRKDAYTCDVTYATNSELGFDHLRDNMVYKPEDQVQRPLIDCFAIVDEVDSILIDESRTPLIISGPGDTDVQLYEKIHAIIPKLTRSKEEGDDGDFEINEKDRQVSLTETGHERVEQLMIEQEILEEEDNLYAVDHLDKLYVLMACLKANLLFEKDHDYIVRDGKAIIIDGNTGRALPDSRWADGLHQAVEVKEGIEVHPESQNLGTTTYQNFFRLYGKLSGMTGTAETDAPEFFNTYDLEVVVIPTRLPIVRKDEADRIYRTEEEKYQAIAEDIKSRQETGQPILVGTASIEHSEKVSKLLEAKGVKHQVLNAKHHEKEASIIAEAGRPGAVTIATNMAGRGTDIILGGSWDYEHNRLITEGGLKEEHVELAKKHWKKRHDKVKALGGLHVLGCERHESRRIDNQLRGRSGRQGDPGSSQFYVSLEDKLMRRFGGERLQGMMERLNAKPGEYLQHSFMDKGIRRAQERVEGHYAEMRARTLKYDDVINEQRLAFFHQRQEVLESQIKINDDYTLDEDISDYIGGYREITLKNLLDTYLPPESFQEQWDVEGLVKTLREEFAINIDFGDFFEKTPDLTVEKFRETISGFIDHILHMKTQQAGLLQMRLLQRHMILESMDKNWRDHLRNIDFLRDGIHLRAVAQREPLQEFKIESTNMFKAMVDSIAWDVIAGICRLPVKSQEQVAQEETDTETDTETENDSASQTDPDSEKSSEHDSMQLPDDKTPESETVDNSEESYKTESNTEEVEVTPNHRQ